MYRLGSSIALGSVSMVQAAANTFDRPHSSRVLTLPSPLSVTTTSTQPENTIFVNVCFFSICHTTSSTYGAHGSDPFKSRLHLEIYR